MSGYNTEDRNKENQANSGLPLTRHSVKQRSVGSSHFTMSSTAAAEMLGIDNITDCSESVKSSVLNLAEILLL